MDNLMSPYSNLSMGTTPLHHPDEDLTFHQNTNVYLPRQMNFGAPPAAPSLLMPPQTPVSTSRKPSITLRLN